MRKILILVTLASLLIISGCDYELGNRDGAPNTLKSYFESDFSDTYSGRVRATVIEKDIGCNDNFNRNVVADCSTFKITLKDTEENFSREFRLHYAYDFVEKGDTCNFLFNKDKIETVLSCDKEGFSKEEVRARFTE